MSTSENAGPELPPAPALESEAEPQPLPEPEPAAVEPPADPQPAADPVASPDPVAGALERLDDRLEESQRLLARQTELATSLHAENQRLRAGELRRAQAPLVRDLIRVQDDLGLMLGAAVESTAAADLQIARDSIVDALARNGIEQLHARAGDALDSRAHKVVGVDAVDDPAADRTIAEAVKIGFVWEDGTAIRCAEVRVYKHVPAAQPAVAADPESDTADNQDP